MKCYHMLVVDQDRRCYLSELAGAMAEGGHLVMLEDHDDRPPKECVEFCAAYCAAHGRDDVPYRPKRRTLFRRRPPGRVCIVCRPVNQRQYVFELAGAGYAVEYLEPCEPGRQGRLLGMIVRRAAVGRARRARPTWARRPSPRAVPRVIT